MSVADGNSGFPLNEGEMEGKHKKIGVDIFKQMLITRCIRPDRMITATKGFIAATLSDYYVQPPSLVYDKIYDKSNERMPIVFILSPGADPQSDVAKLGEQMGAFGYEILATPITDIEPDTKVKTAMNEINRAKRMLTVAEDEGEATKARVLKDAEAAAAADRKSVV